MANPFPTYRFFQSSLVDPALQNNRQIPHPISIMEVNVEASPTDKRTWFIPKTKLRQHSDYFRAGCQYASTKSLTLTDTPPHAFQNFVDFTYSSIYSVNKFAPDYHLIHSHLQAWVLGDKLKADTYQTAALQALYKTLEPLARAVNSSATTSPIRAEDVEYVCENTDMGCVLRAVMFDAVASHWNCSDVLGIGMTVFTNSLAPTSEDPTVNAAWANIYNTHLDFRARMTNSLKLADSHRIDLLHPIADYMAGKKIYKEEEPGYAEAGMAFRRGSRWPVRRRAESGGSLRDPNSGRTSSTSSTDMEGVQRTGQEDGDVEEDEWMTAEQA